MGTRVLGLGLESDSSPDLAGLGLGLESFTSGLGLGLGLETMRTRTRLGLGPSGLDRTRANCTDKNRFQAT